MARRAALVAEQRKREAEEQRATLLRQQVEQAQQAMQSNIEKVLERGDKLDDLSGKAEEVRILYVHVWFVCVCVCVL